MEQFLADLHIHSRFSRATSKELDFRLLAAWSRVKGLDVLGTGDFTHPEWMAEIGEQLEPEDNGLFRLRDDRRLERRLPWLEGYALPGRTRFMLVTEISSIYKAGGKVRKIHNLVFMPTLDAARSFTARLEKVGNLASDGRPILGLPARDLLEMVLQTDPSAFLVPAHVWTPWFSLFGSKSGFDTVEECFGDLSSEIFAMETGLSSDPAMNRMLSALDRYRMISNSDAHSGENLGREANIFSGPPSYAGILGALRGEALGHKFQGTVEFFPEEGKYHLDGHRKCNVVMEPHETRARGGLCPVCGKPLTVGVLNRVMELADREQPVQPPNQPGFMSLVPLPEIISEILGVGPKTKKTRAFYARCIARFGSEMDILRLTPPEDLAKVSPVLAEAVTRMRRGEVVRRPGFDGEYGVISVFSPREQREIRGGKTLVDLPSPRDRAPRPPASDMPRAPLLVQPGLLATESSANEAQAMAMAAGPGPVLVLAGPGTGKTYTLTGRIRSLLASGVNPRKILALTFTRRAAEEMQRRLVAERGERQALPRADTMHALAFDVWTKSWGQAPTVLDDESARRVFFEATGMSGHRGKAAFDTVALARERLEMPPAELRDAAHAYAKVKESWNLSDYTDLLAFWLEQMEADIWANPYTHVLVDEVQDLTPLQLALVRSLRPDGQGVFAIGDPDQSIYGFRGAAGEAAEVLGGWWPDLTAVRLEDNYRSAQAVLDLAAPLSAVGDALRARREAEPEIRLFQAPTAQAEASWIGDRMRELIGGTSHSMGDSQGQGDLSPGDVAVLVRFKALVRPIARVLDRLGIPCAAPEAEAFFNEPRVAAILDAAGRFLGIPGGIPGDAPGAKADDEEAPPAVSVPDAILAQGPVGMAAFLQDIAPFDRMFWDSPAFKRLKAAFEEHGGWAGLLNWVHLQTDMDQVRARAEKVQIMTLHAAKGLEFEAVFLPALEDGIVPFAGSGFLTGKEAGPDAGPRDPEALAEERRLFYVGLTRARTRLYLSHARRRGLYGRELRLGPSRFLGELPGEGMARSAMVGRSVRQEKQLDLLG